MLTLHQSHTLHMVKLRCLVLVNLRVPPHTWVDSQIFNHCIDLSSLLHSVNAALICPLFVLCDARIVRRIYAVSLFDRFLFLTGDLEYFGICSPHVDIIRVLQSSPQVFVDLYSFIKSLLSCEFPLQRLVAELCWYAATPSSRDMRQFFIDKCCL